MTIAVDTYFEAVKNPLTSVRFFTAFIATNGGNALGLNEESAPAIWLVESPSWKDSVDDEKVMGCIPK